MARRRALRKNERGGIGGFFTGLLVFSLILALGAAVAYLMSERNQRQYRLRSHGGIVFVERGRLLPFGFETYTPSAKDLQAAYAPIKVPAGEKTDELETFDDRTELDRALFALLAGWARSRLQATDGESFELASSFVSRCSVLPGLSEEQRAELKSLRADLAYRNGRRIASTIADELDKAVAEFRLALDLGTSRPSDANEWAAQMDKWARSFRTALAGRDQPGGEQAQPAQPAQPEAAQPPRGEPL